MQNEEQAPTMLEVTPRNNIIAFALFLLGKLAGLVGLALGLMPQFRFLGGCILFFAGACLAGTVFFCCLEFRKQKQEEKAQEYLLLHLIQQGTLEQHLLDLGYKAYKVNNERI